VAPPPNAPLAPVADARTEPVFLSHVVERQEFGKAMWDEMASEIPRPQHDGSLKLPTMGAPAAAAADLERLRRQYPSLPYVKPNAAARGMALIDASPDGVWTDELKQRARAGFEAEAAGVEVCVCFPELFAREYLMEDERYRTADGVKTPCMCCKSNKFVLMGSSLNVGTKSSQRYAYGDNRAIFVVSCHYHCFNPDCSSVQEKQKDEALTELRAIVATGVDGSNAEGKIEKLRKLGGPAFKGHDRRVIEMLPPKARQMYQGLIMWEDGGCDDAFACKMLTSQASTAELAAEIAVAAQAKEKAALEAYLRFARCPPSKLTPVVVAPPQAMMKPCYSEHHAKEMLPCNEFSAKQWAKDENKAGFRPGDKDVIVTELRSLWPPGVPMITVTPPEPNK